MPRNGSGVYSKPAGTTAAANTTIESAKYNQTIDDLVSDANTARPIVAGGTGATSVIGAADGFSTKGADIASSTTTDIGAATGRYVNITGTTTITGLGTKTAGVVRICTFTGSLTLTHNATSLILPGGANIQTAAGDVAVFVSEGGGNWRCVNFQRQSENWVDVASATTTDIGAAASQNIRITGTTTITGLGTVAAGTVRYGTFADVLTLTHNATSLILPNGGSNITTAAGDSFRAVSLGSGNWRVTHYQYYSPSQDWVRTRISFSGSGSYSLPGLASAKRLKVSGTVQASTATNLFFRVSTDNGSSYISTSSYDYIYTGYSGGNSQGVITGSSWPIFLNNAKASTPLSINIEIHNFNVAEAKTGNGMSTGLTSADVTQGHTFYFRGPSLTSALNAIQFSANSGNISGDLLVEYYTT